MFNKAWLLTLVLVAGARAASLPETNQDTDLGLDLQPPSKEFNQESTITQENEYDLLAVSPEEEAFLVYASHKLPFKMEKKQLIVLMKVLKEAAKPVLKSKRLRETVSFVDHLLQSLREDEDTRLYMTFILDAVEDMYKGKENSRLKKVLSETFGDFTNEETARQLGDVFDSIGSTIMAGLRNIMTRVSNMARPFTEGASNISNRVLNMVGGDNTHVFVDDVQWSKRANLILDRSADLTHRGARALETIVEVLEAQDS